MSSAREKGGAVTGTFDATIDAYARQQLQLGREAFRFETFGDEAFCGDTLRLHKAVEGAKLGGVGPGVSPKMALSAGLKACKGQI